MLDHFEDMPVLNMIFGRSSAAAPVPKPMIKRRASPLKESPVRDEEDETSDCPMEQVADENPSASQQPENVNMEQVDYDPDSDDDDSNEEGHPPAGRPTSKAMPHPKLVPKRLVPKVKPAPKNILDEETESDNHPGDRPALPRRPAMRPVLTSNDRWFVTYGSDTNISLQKESVHPGPFGRADLPFATIGVFHIHPSISHGAAGEDLQNEIMPLVTLYRCDAITGDANKSANTYSKLQHVFNPANGLVNILMREYQRLWNETKDLPLVDRMEFAMETSCALKSIVRHHLCMKCGSGYDRTFPDVMMTFVFGWGKTNIQQAFRKDEMNGMDDEQLEFMRNHPTKAIFDSQVSSAERFKHVNNDMFMNGSQDSDSHSPLMVYIRSKSATRQRSSERYQEYIKKKQAWTPQEYKDYNKQWKDYSNSTWNDYGDYGSQSDSSRRWYRRSD